MLCAIIIAKGRDDMSEYYDKKAKERMIKYQKTKREMLNLNLPLGTKERWRQQAADKGEKSLTQYIERLIAEDAERF